MDDYDPFTAGRYDPKYAAYGVAWPMEVQSINKGDTRVFSLIDKKIDNTVETLRDTLADQLINGSGAGKNANGLTTLIPATAKTSQSASVGGISPSGNLWWQTQAINMTGMSAATDLENQMLVMYDTIFAETGDPDTIVTDITTKETYENNAKDFITLNGKTKIADVTFEMCQYKGMPIIYDKNAPAGELRMLTREYIKFCVDPDFWFAWTARKDLPNVPFKKFQFARTSARAHGCNYNIAV
jgi:hypothetical protein